MKSLRIVSAALVMAILAASAPVSRLQAAGSANDSVQSAAQAPVTLKVTVVISRFEGEKKTGSLPFVLMVVPNMSTDGRDGEATNLQMGAEVPVMVSVAGSGQPAATSWQYRSVGTNIISQARYVDEGRFNLFLTVTDSQVMSDIPKPGSNARLDPTPVVQSFRTTNRLLMRDGQTTQFTAASDKTSGEVVKVDVTMNVVK